MSLPKFLKGCESFFGNLKKKILKFEFKGRWIWNTLFTECNHWIWQALENNFFLLLLDFTFYTTIRSTSGACLGCLLLGAIGQNSRKWGTCQSTLLFRNTGITVADVFEVLNFTIFHRSFIFRLSGRQIKGENTSTDHMPRPVLENCNGGCRFHVQGNHHVCGGEK